MKRLLTILVLSLFTGSAWASSQAKGLWCAVELPQNDGTVKVYLATFYTLDGRIPPKAWDYTGEYGVRPDPRTSGNTQFFFCKEKNPADLTVLQNDGDHFEVSVVPKSPASIGPDRRTMIHLVFRGSLQQIENADVDTTVGEVEYTAILDGQTTFQRTIPCEAAATNGPGGGF